MSHDVFISYSSNDKAVAFAVCHFLEHRGIRSWIAPRDILPGIVWSEAIVDAISAGKIMVLIFSAHANNSKQVKREAELAVSRELIIIPFRIEDIPLSKSLEYFIGPHHWLDALTPPLEKHIQNLVDKIELILNREPGTAMELEVSSHNNGLFSEISSKTRNWIQSGFQYHILEGISGELKAMLRNPPADPGITDQDELTMLLMASIHFGGNWNIWIRGCENQMQAAGLLLSTLGISYMRPRFRALCALQSFDETDIRACLEKAGDVIDQAARILVNDYVVTGCVHDYLAKIKNGSGPDLARKAAEVLRESLQYSGAGANEEASSGLPLL